MNTTPMMSGRGWAYTGATLGGLVSIAANIAHSYVPPQGAAVDWTPKFGAVIGAVVWPVFLFVAVEILARVAWPHGLTWQLLRWLGLVPVGAVAALVSYRHLSGLLAFYGEEPLVCVLGPLAVDGLMVMATAAILATGQHTRTTASTHSSSAATTAPINTSTTATPSTTASPRTTRTTRTTALPSTTSTTAPTSTTQIGPADPDVPSPVPATTPALVPVPEPATRPEPVTAPRPEPVPTPADVAARVTPSPTSIPLRPTAERPAAARTSKPQPRKPQPTPAKPLAAPATDTPVTEPEPAQLPLPMPVDPSLLAKAREIAQQYRTEHGTGIKPGQLAARLRVNSEQATQALAVLNLGPDNPTTPIPTVNGTPVKATR
jgi:hypothetical protein